MMPMEPWDCFETSYTNSPSFPSLPELDLPDLAHIPLDLTMEPDLLITPMMHNDL